MKGIVALAVLLFASSALAEAFVYEGEWKTTNRKLDGKMTSVVTQVGPEKWQGRFYGIWQGVDFDYTESFTGPANELSGTAVIDGAYYKWRGWITQKKFKANFSGDRYEGSFELLRKAPADPAQDAGAKTTKSTKPSKTTKAKPSAAHS